MGRQSLHRVKIRFTIEGSGERVEITEVEIEVVGNMCSECGGSSSDNTHMAHLTSHF